MSHIIADTTSAAKITVVWQSGIHYLTGTIGIPGTAGTPPPTHTAASQNLDFDPQYTAAKENNTKHVTSIQSRV